MFGFIQEHNTFLSHEMLHVYSIWVVILYLLLMMTTS